MVGWYHPGQLFRTGFELVISTMFARHSDSRRMDALSKPPLIDYRCPEFLDEDGTFGFDYVADTGDGWNSTYAVAYLLSQPVCGTSNQEPLKRGRLLVFGGDLIYPYPKAESYEKRLIAPYAVAGQLHQDEVLDVLAIPGNHDWYDSLVHFRRIFCYGADFGFRNTRQTRSYFAACLPHNWWIFAVDIQLIHDIDQQQLDFFLEIADKLEENERVILCIAEPLWIARWEGPPPSELSPPTLIEILEDRIGKKLRISIAGDLHNYQRHSSSDGRHCIICGTGGAFLHPTHAMGSDPTGTFVHKKSYPSLKASFWLTFRNLRFVTRNKFFGIVPAMAYLLASWQNGTYIGECFGDRSVCIGEMGRMGLGEFRDAVYAGVHSALVSPVGLALYAIIAWGFVFFADRRSSLFRYTVGLLHAFAHIAAGFGLFWFGAYAAITWAGLAPKSIPQYLMTGSIIFVLGWLVGSFVLGVYLAVSLNVCGMHRNEAYSSLRIQDWKGFLRFRIRADGGLEMRFVGIDKVPRTWNRISRGPIGVMMEPAGASGIVGKIVDEVTIT
jgi:hypothetical protein